MSINQGENKALNENGEQIDEKVVKGKGRIPSRA